MLKAVKPGDKVKFVPERINGQFTVTKIQKANDAVRRAHTRLGNRLRFDSN